MGEGCCLYAQGYSYVLSHDLFTTEQAAPYTEAAYPLGSNDNPECVTMEECYCGHALLALLPRGVQLAAA